MNAGALTWSELLERQYGLEMETFGGTFAAYLEHIHPEDRDAVRAVVQEVARSGSDFIVQHRSVQVNGKERWLRGAGRFILDADGQAVRAVGISQDVTASVFLDNQYRQAQKMEAVGRVAAGVAHDFNNLLGAIHCCAESTLVTRRPRVAF